MLLVLRCAKLNHEIAELQCPATAILRTKLTQNATDCSGRKTVVQRNNRYVGSGSKTNVEWFYRPRTTL